jgi:hypothetical protein
MKGIPVRANGDPVTLTLVYAGSYTQFGHWCMYSRVNPRSRMVRYLYAEGSSRGYQEFDLVYTGTPKDFHDSRCLANELRYHQAVGNIRRIYDQYELCEIEPDVVE